MDIFDVANMFLSHSPMAHKKLQKLCYYAKAWYWALFNHALFNEKFEAWVHGPVCPALYRQYRDYGWDDIPQSDIDTSKFEQKAIEITEAVYHTYGGFSGDELETLTHSELPWKSARGSLEAWEPSQNVIDEKLMREYYLRIYEQSQSD